VSCLFVSHFYLLIKLIAKSLGTLCRRHFLRNHRRKDSTLLSLLNSQNPSIKFTYEEEVDGSLPFLDVRVTRRDSRIEFDVYRKLTNTQRCIPITSCHPMVPKMAAFHSMLHWACNLPLSRKNFEKEVAPLTGSCRNIFSNVRSRKSPHCHPSAKRLQLS
jgi:hypothetical protein